MKVRNVIITLLTISSLLGSCSDGTTNMATKASKEEIKKLPVLVSCSHEFVMYDEDNRLYYDDHENFIDKHFSIKHEDKRITVTTLIRVHCSDSLIGKIDVSNDTIYLKSDILMRNGRPCPEFHEFKFIISNPNNFKYTITSSK